MNSSSGSIERAWARAAKGRGIFAKASHRYNRSARDEPSSSLLTLSRSWSKTSNMLVGISCKTLRIIDTVLGFRI